MPRYHAACTLKLRGWVTADAASREEALEILMGLDPSEWHLNEVTRDWEAIGELTEEE